MNNLPSGPLKGREQFFSDKITDTKGKTGFGAAGQVFKNLQGSFNVKLARLENWLKGGGWVNNKSECMKIQSDIKELTAIVDNIRKSKPTDEQAEQAKGVFHDAEKLITQLVTVSKYLENKGADQKNVNDVNAAFETFKQHVTAFDEKFEGVAEPSEKFSLEGLVKKLVDIAGIDKLEYSKVVTPPVTPPRNFGLKGLNYVVAAPDTMNTPAMLKILTGPKVEKTLVLVDCQNGFIDNTQGEKRTPGLAVNGANTKVAAIVDIINNIASGKVACDQIIITCDNHPKDHSSFAREGETPAQTKRAVTYSDGTTHDQTVWPTHCVQGSQDAELHKDICAALRELQAKLGDKAPRVILCPKGEGESECYSACNDVNDKKLPLRDVMKYTCKENSQPVVVGFATDYCVVNTANGIAGVGSDLAPVICTAAAASVFEKIDDKGVTFSQKDGERAGAADSKYLNGLKKGAVTFRSEKDAAASILGQP